MNFKLSYEVLESDSIELNSDKSFIDIQIDDKKKELEH